MVDAAIKEFSNKKQFPIKEIKIIEDPNSFYELILEKLRTSNSVFLACLVLGAGEKTKILLNILKERMLQNKKTAVFIDKARNLGDPELVKYINENNLGDIIQMVDYRKCSYLPHLLNEFLGVYHLKAYVFDDEVCISGANLNDHYFTDRIDRYYLIKDKDLSESVIKSVFKEQCDDCDFEKCDTNNLSYIKNNINMDNIKVNSIKYTTNLFKFTDKDEIKILKKIFSFKFKEIFI